MNVRKFAAAAGAAVSMLVTPVVAHAATATVQLGSFHIQLFDLDPLDGIAPTLTWVGTPYARSFAVMAQPGSIGASEHNAGLIGEALSASAVTPGSAASSSITPGQVLALNGGVSSSVSASATGGDSGYAGAEIVVGVFSLSAKTLMVVSATPGLVQSSAVLGETADAMASLSIQGLVSGAQNSHASTYDTYRTSGDTLHHSQSLPPGLTMSWVNLSSGSASGEMSATLRVEVSSVTAVPEVSAAVLMLVGLLGVGPLAMRRRR
ncbi:hypothetical protein [Aquabacterium sp. OR-4]|uniref:hypothetical protein n=1 Tax=Aquabacterium sp. OR-4 TaxID=2978127 RepID=UPI0021B2B147|nr:hypothetical protein [Aquabacterium sp. OR-4]MDT7836530.1 hypothetical protein [Aquabacterium sp. OR-4]